MVKGAVAPLLINQASADPRFANHPGLHLYGIESYIAVPLYRRDGSYFGTLCALDPRPASLNPDNFDVFHLLAQLIAFELEAGEHRIQRDVALRAMEDFVAVAAHDLRQPLSVLYGRAQLLARQAGRGASAEDLTKGITLLLGQARRAVSMSDLLLDVARLETGSFALTLDSTDLVKLVHDALDEARATAPPHTFIYTGPETLLLRVDANRIGQVLRNLLDNAVKYAPGTAGPITMTLTDSSPADPDAVLLTISDSGIGVPAAELGQLFERHYRATNAVADRIPGSGLGLYIAREVVTAHGGRIWAESALGGGLTVYLRLPHA